MECYWIWHGLKCVQSPHEQPVNVKLITLVKFPSWLFQVYCTCRVIWEPEGGPDGDMIVSNLQRILSFRMYSCWWSKEIYLWNLRRQISCRPLTFSLDIDRDYVMLGIGVNIITWVILMSISISFFLCINFILIILSVFVHMYFRRVQLLIFSQKNFSILF